MTDELKDILPFQPSGGSQMSLSDPHEAGGYIWSKDEQGRDIARPTRALVERQRETAWNRMMEDAELPEIDIGPNSLNTYQRQKYDALILESPDALFTGPAGRGKTIVALLAAKHLHTSGVTVGLTRFGRYHEMMLPGHEKRYGVSPDTIRARFTTPKILLIDDVGSGRKEIDRVSEYASGILWELVSARCREPGHATWVTTNLSMSEFERHFGGATISRLARQGRSILADFEQVTTNYRTGVTRG